MSAQYVLICSTGWQLSGGSAVCTGTLKSVAVTELNPSGLSPEDHVEYRGLILSLFVVVFGFLVLKKVLLSR